MGHKMDSDKDTTYEIMEQDDLTKKELIAKSVEALKFSANLYQFVRQEYMGSSFEGLPLPRKNLTTEERIDQLERDNAELHRAFLEFKLQWEKERKGQEIDKTKKIKDPEEIIGFLEGRSWTLRTSISGLRMTRPKTIVLDTNVILRVFWKEGKCQVHPFCQPDTGHQHGGVQRSDTFAGPGRGIL